MSYFLAVSAVRSDDVSAVCDALSEYCKSFGVSTSVLPPAEEPDYGTDAQIFNAVNGWITILWPDYFNVYDFPLVRSVAARANLLISTVHVYDEQYWEHLCHCGSEELQAFCSRPEFWKDESPADYDRARGYDKDPARLCAKLNVPSEAISPYLIDVDTIPFDVKAFPDDEFSLDNFWVFTDFWRRLGIEYPDPAQNVAVLLRLGEGFEQKLPPEE